MSAPIATETANGGSLERVVSWLRGLLKKRPKKEYVQCPECEGMGLTFNKNLMWQLPCKRCNQTGKIEKPANDGIEACGVETPHQKTK